MPEGGADQSDREQLAGGTHRHLNTSGGSFHYIEHIPQFRVRLTK
jgi:hypothetical protein